MPRVRVIHPQTGKVVEVACPSWESNHWERAPEPGPVPEPVEPATTTKRTTRRRRKK